MGVLILAEELKLCSFLELEVRLEWFKNRFILKEVSPEIRLSLKANHQLEIFIVVSTFIS